MGNAELLRDVPPGVGCRNARPSDLRHEPAPAVGCVGRGALRRIFKTKGVTSVKTVQEDSMAGRENPNEGELILYKTPEGLVRIEVLYESETFWLNQKKIAELFGVDLRTISEHLRNIFASRELDEPSVLRKIRTTAADGKRYLVNFYNLDAIISVGYLR